MNDYFVELILTLFFQFTGAGSKGPCRHFNTSIYPANQIALFEASKRKTRTRSISRLVNTGPDPEHVVTSLPKRAYLLNDMLAQPKSPFRQPTAQQANPQIGFSPVSDFESIVGGEQREFAKRHLALRIDENISSLREKKELNSMLSAIGVSSVEELINQTVPRGIRLTETQEIAYDRVLSEPMSELQVQQLLREYSEMNKTWKTYIGQGWSPCETPSVIANNVLRNPAWNTAYTEIITLN